MAEIRDSATIVDSIEHEIRDLGNQIEERRKRLELMLVGRDAVTGEGVPFRIDRVQVYQGGAGFRVMLVGPRVTKWGKLHDRARESSLISMLRSLT